MAMAAATDHEDCKSSSNSSSTCSSIPPSSAETRGWLTFTDLVEDLRVRFVIEDEFRAFTTNLERIEYCLGKDGILDCFRQYVAQFEKRREFRGKSVQQAKMYRLEGNKHFKAKDYEKSMSCYTQALMYAPFPKDQGEISQELYSAFANRSAALFQRNKFEECATAIQLALEHGYPSNQHHMLLLRKAMCLKAADRIDEAEVCLTESLRKVDSCLQMPGIEAELLETNKSNLTKFIKSTFDAFNLKCKVDDSVKYDWCHQSHGQNERLPSCHQAVQLTAHQEKGRKLFVKRSCERDELMIAEKPIACILNDQFQEHFCHHCCTELNEKLYPCRNCSHVRFCSESCFEEAWLKYHSSECSEAMLIQSTGTIYLALRIVLSVGLAKMKSVRSSVDQLIQKHQYPAADRKIERDSYDHLLTLLDHSEEIPFVVSARQTLAATFYLTLMRERMNLIASDDPDYIFIGSLILKHIQQISINSVVIFHQPLVPGPFGLIGIDVKNQIIGTALYPMLSLVNHSCRPNCESFFKGNLLNLRTRMDIAKGEELTFSYGPLYRLMARNERLKNLKSQYYFNCACECCVTISLESKSDEVLELRKSQLLDALLCPQCRVPFFVDYSSTTASCSACESSPNDTKSLLIAMNDAKRLLNIGKSLMQWKKVPEAEKQFQKALVTFQEFCAPENRLIISTLDELTFSNILLENYDLANKFCDRRNKVKERMFGGDSPDHMTGVLQLLNIKWKQEKKLIEKVNSNRTTSINKKLANKLAEKTDETLTKTHTMLKRFTTCDQKILILDSAIVACLKELVELDNFKKS